MPAREIAFRMIDDLSRTGPPIASYGADVNGLSMFHFGTLFRIGTVFSRRQLEGAEDFPQQEPY
jgi:hypothetical protein